MREWDRIADNFLWEELDFSRLDQVIQQQNLLSQQDFKSLIEKFLKGEAIDKKWLADTVFKLVFQEITASRAYIVQVILLVAAFALLYQFVNVVENNVISDISFYVVYMILLSLLMKNFLLMSGILNDTLTTMKEFLEILMPVFSLLLVISTGSISAWGFYQISLLLVYLVEVVLLYVVVPGIHVYILLEMMNHLTKEEWISKMTKLVKSGIPWMMKGLMTMVIGLNFIQGLIGPAMDQLKSNTLMKTAGTLPGIGGSIQAMTEIMMSSGIVIKNGAGVAALWVLCMICAGPLIKIGVMAFLYKVSAAIIQPIADKRFLGCIHGMGEGAGLFGKVLLLANAMLVLSIAITTATTTWNR